MPADILSDIDLALFVRDPGRLLHQQDWIAGLGSRWTSHLESNALETGQERRVLFQDGQDVDFAVFPVELLGALTSDPRGAAVLRKGFRPLVNKDSLELVLPKDEPPAAPPSSIEFSNLVNDYWFHLVWTAKKLRRGELLIAVLATNGYLGQLLVRLARWHAISRGSSGGTPWHGARFFEKWADPRIVRDLSVIASQYSAPSVAQALRAHRALLRWLGNELQESLSFPNPVPDEESLSEYLDRMLDLGQP